MPRYKALEKLSHRFLFNFSCADGTRAPCSGSTELKPPNCQGTPPNSTQALKGAWTGCALQKTVLLPSTVLGETGSNSVSKSRSKMLWRQRNNHIPVKSDMNISLRKSVAFFRKKETRPQYQTHILRTCNTDSTILCHLGIYLDGIKDPQGFTHKGIQCSIVMTKKNYK